VAVSCLVYVLWLVVGVPAGCLKIIATVGCINGPFEKSDCVLLFLFFMYTHSTIQRKYMMNTYDLMKSTVKIIIL